MKRQRDFRKQWVSLLALFIIVAGEVMGEEPALDKPDEVIEVMGLACIGAEYRHYVDGTPQFCRLAREGTLSGQLFAATTVMHFTREGVFDWCFLPEDTQIQGISCRGGGHNFMTEFHPNGKLRRAYLAEDQIIQSIPCSKFRSLSATFWPIHGKKGGTDFFSNGRLSSCELSEATEIESLRFNRRDEVRFDADGKLMTAPKEKVGQARESSAKNEETLDVRKRVSVSVVYEDKFGSMPWTPSGWMGSTDTLALDGRNTGNPHAGKACIKMRYTGKFGWVGVAWQHPANNWGDQEGGYDLSDATELELWARGEYGGERINIGVGLLGKDKAYPDSGKTSIEDIALKREWQRYHIPLKDIDLSSIKTGFVVTITGQQTPVTIYLDSIRFVR
jgi:hypothetical protein